MLEFNYYNIIPILLIELLLVYIFESILYIYLVNPVIIKNTSDNLAAITCDSNTCSQSILYYDDKHHLAESINNEKKYISTQKTYGSIILSCAGLGLLILLFIYKYIVVNIMKKKIEWINCFIIIICITVVIIFVECLYIFVIAVDTPINILENAILIKNIIREYALTQNPQPS